MFERTELSRRVIIRLYLAILIGTYSNHKKLDLKSNNILLPRISVGVRTLQVSKTEDNRFDSCHACKHIKKYRELLGGTGKLCGLDNANDVKVPMVVLSFQL